MRPFRRFCLSLNPLRRFLRALFGGEEKESARSAPDPLCFNFGRAFIIYAEETCLLVRSFARLTKALHKSARAMGSREAEHPRAPCGFPDPPSGEATGEFMHERKKLTPVTRLPILRKILAKEVRGPDVEQRLLPSWRVRERTRFWWM